MLCRRACALKNFEFIGGGKAFPLDSGDDSDSAHKIIKWSTTSLDILDEDTTTSPKWAVRVSSTAPRGYRSRIRSDISLNERDKDHVRIGSPSFKQRKAVSQENISCHKGTNKSNNMNQTQLCDDQREIVAKRHVALEIGNAPRLGTASTSSPFSILICRSLGFDA